MLTTKFSGIDKFHKCLAIGLGLQNSIKAAGSDFENFSYSLGSSGVRLYREKMFLGKMQSVFHHEDKA